MVSVLHKSIRVILGMSMLIPSFAFAGKTATQRWCDAAMSLMSSKNVSEKDCQSNVAGLLSMFVSENAANQAYAKRCAISSAAIPASFLTSIPIEKAKVLFLFPSGRGMPLRAFNTSSLTTSWDYHVVIEIEGKIIDLDMNRTTEFPSIEVYFKKMFLPEDALQAKMYRSLGLLSSNNPIEDISVKAIPAVEFQEKFDKIYNGIIRSSSYYFGRMQIMKGVSVQKYFKIRLPEAPEVNTREINPQLPGIIKIVSNPEIDGIPYLEWKYEKTKCVLDLSTGEITLFRGKKKKMGSDQIQYWYEDQEVSDAGIQSLFIQKLYFESLKNPKLKKIIDAGTEYRFSFN